VAAGGAGKVPSVRCSLVLTVLAVVASIENSDTVRTRRSATSSIDRSEAAIREPATNFRCVQGGKVLLSWGSG
jgi:hypothetical protein